MASPGYPGASEGNGMNLSKEGEMNMVAALRAKAINALAIVMVTV